MTETVLALHGVSKSYGQNMALDGVSFSIASGEFVGLLGPNGAGKSTLFQIVAGLFAADVGDVQLFGLSHREGGSAVLAGLGMVFQARSIDLDMTVLANLRFHGRLFGLSGAALLDRITALATQFGLAEFLTRPVRSLSGGQQRRVEIARAMINRPDLLIMDEPSAGLDTTSRGDFVSLIQDLAGKENVAILWATHLVDEVVDADRLIILDNGHIRANDSPAALLAATGATDLDGVYRAFTGDAAQLTGEQREAKDEVLSR